MPISSLLAQNETVHNYSGIDRNVYSKAYPWLPNLEISRFQSLISFHGSSKHILNLLSLSQFVLFPKEHFEPAQTHTNKLINKTQYKGTEISWLK